jgi:hypothetical protein
MPFEFHSGFSQNNDFPIGNLLSNLTKDQAFPRYEPISQSSNFMEDLAFNQ